MKQLLTMLCQNDKLRYLVLVVISSIQVLFSIVVMALLGVTLILWINLLGLFLLLLSYFVFKQQKTYLLYVWFILYATISILLTTPHIEYTYGFVYYLILIVPFGFVFLFDLIAFSKVILSVSIGTILALVTYLVYHQLLNHFNPVSKGSETFAYTVQYINVFLIVVILFVFTLMFAIRLECAKDREKQIIEKLEYEITHDPLTGLYNRSFIDHIIQDTTFDESNWYVALCDINTFKKINDTYGHLIGDAVLKKVANAIKNALPQNAFAIRWGGEEFVILLQDISEQEVKAIIAKVKQYVQAIEIESHKEIQTSIAIGYAKHHQHDSIDKAISKADARMYEDKANHKSNHQH